jgi:hypothetical protein
MLTSPPGEQQTVVIQMGIDQDEGPSRIIECIEDLNTDSIPLKRALPLRNRRKPLRYRTVNQRLN